MIPKLSVVVPVYNTEKYLPQCLDSLINQTLREMEIILVNDGSTDNSRAICEAYAEKDERIRVFTLTNGGVSAARNFGLKQATAEVIGFVDSDDELDRNMFQGLLGIKERSNSQIAVGGIKMMSTDGAIYQIRSVAADRVYNRHDAMEELLHSKRISSSLCNKIFDVSLFEQIEFPVGKLYEDEYAVFLLFARAERVVITNQVFYCYRFTPKSITHSTFSEGDIDRIHVNLMKVDYIQKEFPDLMKYAQRYLVYVCVMALSKMTEYKKSNDVLVRNNIRKHLICFLKGNYSLGTKAFALVGACSPELAVKLYSLVKRK